MKKIPFLIGLLIISGSLFAQQTVKLSFSTGPSINWMSSNKDVVSGGGVKAGYDFGLVADIYFDPSQHYAFTSGLLLTHTGGELEYHNTEPFEFAGKNIDPGNSIHYRLKYLEVPLAIKLKSGPVRRWAFWGQFGLSGFINVGAKGDTTDKEILDKTDIKDEIKAMNVAVNVGVGGDFDLGADIALSMGIIFKDGLTDVTKTHINEGKTTVNSINFKIGVIF
jgi:hypothetical protein